MPNRESVKKVRHALKTTADYVFFFDKLKSAAWITPLAEEGFFSQPPTGEEVDNGGIRFPPWPESQYLARVAEGAPEIAIDVATKVPQTDNPSVQRDLTAVALKVPPHLARRMVGSVSEWISSPYSGWMHQEYFGRFLLHLAKGNEIDAALKIAKKLLEFAPDPEQEQKRSALETDPTGWIRLEPHSRSPGYVYSEILESCIPALVEVAPVETISLLAKLLSEAIALGTRNPKIAAGQDWSAIWLPTLDSRSHHLDSKAALAASLVRSAEAVLSRNVSYYLELKEVLSSHSWRIFERILVRLASQYPEVGLEDIRRFIIGFTRYEGTDFDDESFDLIHNHFKLLDAPDRHEIVRLILKGPVVATYIENRKSRGDEPSSNDLDRYVRRWKILRLYPIKDYLSEEELVAYRELVEDSKEPEPRNYVRNSRLVETSWGPEIGWGPHSPKSGDEFGEMVPKAALDYLKKWQWVKGFNAPSPEGLARTFQEAVAARALNYSSEATSFTGIEPAYVRALISGLSAAVKNKQQIDWHPVLELCRWVVIQPVEIEGRSKENWDWVAGDPDWRGARKAIAGLIENGAHEGAGETPISYRAQVFNVLRPLTQDTNPTPDYEEASGWKNQPVTVAINTVRGEAMHALLAHAVWVRRHLPKDALKGFSAMTEIKEVLEERLDPTIDSTCAIRSVFGQFLPWLWYLDQVWTQKSLTRIFPRSADQKRLNESAWNSYVTFNQPNGNIFKLLASEYQRAIDNLSEATGTEHDLRDPQEALAEHLVVLYWQNVLDFGSDNDLLEQFYSTASVHLRAHIIEFVGKALGEAADDVPESVKTRLMELWERRFLEAKQFGKKSDYDKELLEFAWWLHSQRLNPRWLLEQTREVLHFCKTVIHEPLFTKPLMQYSENFPVETVRCISLLVEKSPPDRAFALHEDEVRRILTSALASKDSEAAKLAIETRDLLLARGNFAFRDIGKG